MRNGVALPHRDVVADLELHQVFAHFQRAVVSLRRLGDEIVEGGRRNFRGRENQMRVGGELRLVSPKHQSGLARRRVVRQMRWT